MSSPAASPTYSTWGITAYTCSLIGGAVFYLPQCLLNSRAQGREVLHGRAPEAETVGYVAQVSWLAERFLSLRDAAAVVLGGQGGVLVTLFEAALSSARMAGLSALMAAFVGLWAVSTYLGDVSIVDSLWSLGTEPLLQLQRCLRSLFLAYCRIPAPDVGVQPAPGHNDGVRRTQATDSRRCGVVGRASCRLHYMA